MESTVSVIVPVYNVEKYLRKCIDSIINQTYKDLEIILVNDGSTDCSGEICNEYKRLDNRVKVIHKENGGLSDARNIGLKHSTGSYIAFIDSDDYIADNMIESLYFRLLNDNSDIAICRFYHIFENGNEVPSKSKKTACFKDEVISKYTAFNRLNNVEYVIACNKIYKKKIFDSISYPKRKYNEDAFVIHKVYDKCERISVLSKQLYFYVKRNDSITNSRLDKNTLDLAEALYERSLFAIDNNLYDLAYCSVSKMASVITDFTPVNEEMMKIKESFLLAYFDISKKLRIDKLSLKRKILVILLHFNPKFLLFIKKRR